MYAFFIYTYLHAYLTLIIHETRLKPILKNRWRPNSSFSSLLVNVRTEQPMLPSVHPALNKSKSPKSRSNFENCFYWITAATGCVVRLEESSWTICWWKLRCNIYITARIHGFLACCALGRLKECFKWIIAINHNTQQ